MKRLSIILRAVAIVLLFDGCMPAPNAPKDKEHNSTQTHQESIGTTSSMPPPQRMQNMVHIVRKANGTTIEFWVDLYNDDVKIDYEFDDSQNLQEKVELLETKFIDSYESQKSKALEKKHQKELHQFMSLYEKAQQLAYDKKLVQALDAIDDALQLSPNAIAGMKLKGSILYKMNNKIGARKIWQEVLRLDPYASDVRKLLEELEKESGQ